MLRHRLLCDEPKTMAELMTVADQYATADAAMKKPLRVNTEGRPVPTEPAREKPAGQDGDAESSRRHGNDSRYQGKRPVEQQSPRYHQLKWIVWAPRGGGE